MNSTNMPDYFSAGSALREFLAGRLGAPECWPDGCKFKTPAIRNQRLVHRSGGIAIRASHGARQMTPVFNKPIK
jgi:hypothetical protein